MTSPPPEPEETTRHIVLSRVNGQKASLLIDELSAEFAEYDVREAAWSLLASNQIELTADRRLVKVEKDRQEPMQSGWLKKQLESIGQCPTCGTAGDKRMWKTPQESEPAMEKTDEHDMTESDWAELGREFYRAVAVNCSDHVYGCSPVEVFIQVIDQRDDALERVTSQQQDIARLTGMLAECFKMAGADPDGNEDWRLAGDAVRAVKDLRADYDATGDEIARLTTERDAALQCQSAYDAVTRAIAEAVGSGDPGGPYWEDGVRWLQQRAEAAEAQLTDLRRENEAKEAHRSEAQGRWLSERQRKEDAESKLAALQSALTRVVEEMKARVEDWEHRNYRSGHYDDFGAGQTHMAERCAEIVSEWVAALTAARQEQE